MLDKKGSGYLTGLIVSVCLLAALLVNPLRDILNHKVISWDGFGYYMYLPSAFIYHDFTKLDYISTIFYKYEFSTWFFQAFKVDNGNYVFNYPMGVAILQLPFFLLGHGIALLLGYPADGFSRPYQLMIVVAAVFYTLLGLRILYKLLNRYFDSTVSLLTCAAILLGTNLYNYGYTEPCMSHAYIFFLLCGILYIVDGWYEKATTRSSLLLGLATGLMIICRPTLLVALILVLLWKADSIKKIKQNTAYIFSHWKQVLIAMAACAIPVLLQMSYWKMATGHWLFNTYGYQQLGFDFLRPNLYNGLIGMRKGWLVYTPLVLVMLSGFLIWKNYKTRNLLAVLVYVVIDVYIVFSWRVWDYGGGFSARAMVEAYVALAFPFAGVIEKVFRNKKAAMLLLSVILFFCFLNLYQTWQYKRGVIYTVGLSNKYEYQKIFLKPVHDILPANKVNEEGFVKPEHIQSVQVLLDTTYAALLPCDDEHLYINAPVFTGKQLKTMKGNRFRYTVKVGYEPRPDLLLNDPATLYMVVENHENVYFTRSENVLAAFTIDKPGLKVLEMQVPGPEKLRDEDNFKMFLMNETPKTLRVYSQKIELLQIK